MSIKKLFNHQFRLIFLFIILAEIISSAGYLFPAVNALGFFIIVILALILSFYRLEYGLAILLTELFIGSKGYLFYLTIGGFTISLRIALWLIIMSVWLGQTIISWARNKKLDIQLVQSSYFYYFIILFLFIFWGVINGLLNHNELSNIFFDANGWLYFALILPIFTVAAKPDSCKILSQVFAASASWIILETLIFVFLFSHGLTIAFYGIYPWIRDTGVGEITQVQGGFYRVFFQAHIFILISFFIVSIYWAKSIIDQAKNNKSFLSNIIILVLILTVITAGFSRSFWLGAAAGIITIWSVWIFKEKIKFKNFLIINTYWLIAAIISLLLVACLVKFPYPAPIGGFNTADLLSSRASQITGEAGASSRWSLLPNLWAKIKTSPMFGRGFGTTVTYKTDDPRVLESNPTGLYTTYAFEWGWLDIWLKLGLLGLLAYFALFAKIIFNAFKNNSSLSLSLATGLIVLAAVNVFSPYVNHPLGIGYLIIVAAIITYEKYEKRKI